MELSDLKIFQAVVEEGGITRAADKLLRVQSSVTTRIKQLEQNLGVELFLREGKKLHLTVSERDGKWTCAEIACEEALGYGEYAFQLRGRARR